LHYPILRGLNNLFSYEKTTLIAVPDDRDVRSCFRPNTIETEDNILQIGLGTSPNYYSYNFGFTPTVSLGFQRGITELGPGTLTLGLIGAFNSRSYTELLYG
jgi:hypothetical protein